MGQGTIDEGLGYDESSDRGGCDEIMRTEIVSVGAGNRASRVAWI